MDILEIEERLNEFALFLENEKPSLRKHRIGRFFTAFIELYNKYLFLENKIYQLEKQNKKMTL